MKTIFINQTKGLFTLGSAVVFSGQVKMSLCWADGRAWPSFFSGAWVNGDGGENMSRGFVSVHRFECETVCTLF